MSIFSSAQSTGLTLVDRQGGFTPGGIFSSQRAPAASDPSFANVSLLCPFDSDTTDVTGTVSSFTAFGTTPTVTATHSVFGGGSLNLNANGNLDTTEDNAAFEFGTGDFTVEMWCRCEGGFTGDAVGDLLFYIGNRTNRNAFWLSVSDAQSSPSISILAGYNGSSWAHSHLRIVAIDYNTWTHIAVCRKSGSAYVYKDGVEYGPLAFSEDLSAAAYGSQISIGNNGGTFTRRVDAQIDDLRVTKGVARYGNGNFTPPTEAYPTS